MSTTRLLCNGIRSSEPLEAVLGPEVEMIDSDPDLLVLGRSPVRFRAQLAGLRYRVGRRTPFLIAPDGLSLQFPDVPYVTYGETEDAHVRLIRAEGDKLQVETPVGNTSIEVGGGWDPLECLAAIAAGLACRIPIPSIVERLHKAARAFRSRAQETQAEAA